MIAAMLDAECASSNLVRFDIDAFLFPVSRHYDDVWPYSEPVRRPSCDAEAEVVAEVLAEVGLASNDGIAASGKMHLRYLHLGGEMSEACAKQLADVFVAHNDYLIMLKISIDDRTLVRPVEQFTPQSRIDAKCDKNQRLHPIIRSLKDALTSTSSPRLPS